jgi:N,N'-diacetylchitobiose transport system permease protein
VAGAAQHAIAAGTGASRRRRGAANLFRRSTPYWLVLPVLAAMAAILGYPLYDLVRLSFEHYTLFELIRHHGAWVGLANYGAVLRDPVLWRTLARTVAFTVVNVALTMALGTLLALLLTRVSGWVRILLTAGLVLVWSMPAVVAVQVWTWMTNFQNGVVNYVLTRIGVGDYTQHDWLATTLSQLGLATSVIVWGALPFVAITVYAALAQVPNELVEAAAIDGAGPLARFRDVTLPVIRPVLLILTSLSIIWDFGVFTQPYLLWGQSKIHPGNYLMGIYLFEEGYFKSDYGHGATIAILMLLMVAALSVVYVRRMIAIGDDT